MDNVGHLLFMSKSDHDAVVAKDVAKASKASVTSPEEILQKLKNENGAVAIAGSHRTVASSEMG